MHWYITNIRPTHPIKGDQTIITIREFNPKTMIGATYHLLANIPHRFFTSPISDIEATKLKTSLQEFLKGTPYTTNEIPYYPNRILTLDTAKDTKTLLDAPFVTKNPSYHTRHLQYPPSTYLRYLYPPCTTIENPSHLPPTIITPPQYNLHPPIESIINDTHVTLDIELDGWKQGKDQIFMAIYLSQNHHILLHNLPFNQTQLRTIQQANKSPDLENITLLRYRTQQDLGEILTELIHTDDPLWIFGHNIMSFDQIKIRNITKTYTPGTQGKRPLIKSVQGLGKVITQGRFTLDTHKFAKNHRSLFQNTKLETLVGFEKTIDYDEQEILLAQAKAGNQQVFETLATYCIMDGIHAQNLALEIRPIVANLAHFFGRDPDTISATSHPTIVNDFLERQHFYTKGYPSRKNIHTGIRNIPAKEYIHNAILTHTQKTIEQKTTTTPNQEKTTHPHTQKTTTTQALKFKQGFIETAYVISLTPALHAAQEFLQNTTLYRAAQETNDPIIKMDYFNSLQEITRPLFEQATRLKTKVPTDEITNALRNLSKRYGLKPQQIQNFMTNLTTNIQRVHARIQQQGYINSSPLLYLLEKEIDASTLEKNGMGVYLGSGPVLSLSPGRFVTDPHPINLAAQTPYPRIYQGINATFHTRTDFEKVTLQAIIDQFFNHESHPKILHNLNEQLEQYYTGQLPIAAYYITQKTRSFYKEEFNQILNTSTASSETKIAFQQMKHRIHDHFSPDAKKELEVILSQTKDIYAHAYLIELHDKIINPYPPSMYVTYAAGTQHIHTTKSTTGVRAILRPINEGHPPALDIYQTKAERTFADIKRILAQNQQLNLI